METLHCLDSVTLGGGEARFTTLRDAISRQQDYNRQLDASPTCDGPFWARLLTPFKTIFSCVTRFFFIPLLISFFSWFCSLHSHFLTRVHLTFISNCINVSSIYFLVVSFFLPFYLLFFFYFRISSSFFSFSHCLRSLSDCISLSDLLTVNLWLLPENRRGLRKSYIGGGSL